MKTKPTTTKIQAQMNFYSELQGAFEKLGLFEAVLPDELKLLDKGKSYSVYSIHARLQKIGKFKGDQWQLMQLINDSKEYELKEGFVKRLK